MALSMPLVKQRSAPRPYFLAMCTLVRNEARWLPEWLSYHSLPSTGFQHFYLYDDDSADATEAAISPYVDAGLVTYYRNWSDDWTEQVDLIGRAFPLQAAMVKHCGHSHVQHATWIGFLDVDEFVLLPDRIQTPSHLRSVGETSAVRMMSSLPMYLRSLGHATAAVVLFGCVALQPDSEAGLPLLLQQSSQCIDPATPPMDTAANTKWILRPEEKHPDIYGSIHGMHMNAGMHLESRAQMLVQCSDKSPRCAEEGDSKCPPVVEATWSNEDHWFASHCNATCGMCTRKSSTIHVAQFTTEPMYIHYRHRALSARRAVDYLGPPGAQQQKAARLVQWAEQHRAAIAAPNEFTKPKTNLLRAAGDVMIDLSSRWPRAAEQPPPCVSAIIDAANAFARRRKVVLVAEGRSGSTSFAYHAFGLRDDFAYWYEPCRLAQRTNYAAAPSLSGADCASLIDQILSCRLNPKRFLQLLSDFRAIHSGKHAWFPRNASSKWGATASMWLSEGVDSWMPHYLAMMRSCWATHGAIKEIRLADTPPLPPPVSSVLLVRHPADVIASRLTYQSFAGEFRDEFNPHGGDRGIANQVCTGLAAQLRWHRSQFTIRMEDYLRNPEAQLTKAYYLVGLPEEIPTSVHAASTSLCRDGESFSFRARIACPQVQSNATSRPNIDPARTDTDKFEMVLSGEWNRADVDVASELKARRGALWKHVKIACKEVLPSLYDSEDLVLNGSGSRVDGSPATSRWRMDADQRRPIPPPTLRIQLLDKLVPVERLNMLVCCIQKNAMLVIATLLALLQGGHEESIERLLTTGATSVFTMSEGGSFPWNATFRPLRRRITSKPMQALREAEARLSNPVWQKLVVLRKPVERFVSAYRSRCLNMEATERAGTQSCASLFHAPPGTTPSIDFVASRLHLARHDPHFALQSSFCGGIGATIAYYDDVIHFDNLTHGVLSVLRGRITSATMSQAEHLLATHLTLGHSPTTSHVTRASKHVADLSDAARAVVERFYREDFALLKLPLPQGARGVLWRGQRTIRGGDLNLTASPCAATSANDAPYETCEAGCWGQLEQPGMCASCRCKLCAKCVELAALRRESELPFDEAALGHVRVIQRRQHV